jgi:hypothetical protein
MIDLATVNPPTPESKIPIGEFGEFEVIAAPDI